MILRPEKVWGLRALILTSSFALTFWVLPGVYAQTTTRDDSRGSGRTAGSAGLSSGGSSSTPAMKQDSSSSDASAARRGSLWQQNV